MAASPSRNMVYLLFVFTLTFTNHLNLVKTTRELSSLNPCNQIISGPNAVNRSSLRPIMGTFMLSSRFKDFKKTALTFPGGQGWFWSRRRRGGES